MSALLPTGVITMWSGSVASIPSGWYLCDGSNSTPDLRNRFIVGAGSTYAVAATGGSADAIVVSHTHTGTTAGAGAHTHTMNASREVTNTPTDRVGDNGTFADGTKSFGMSNPGNHVHTFTTDSTGSSGTNANLPPYYALAYIMKA
jgi:microcystin-dependent protein